MRRLRDLLTALALAAMTCVSLAAAVQVVRQGLPVTPLEDRRDTLDWLASDDLSQADPETQRKLIRRLEQEFDQRSDWQSRLDQLDRRQRERVRTNFAPLARRWFLDTVDAYHARPEQQRQAFLDLQLDKVERWYSVGSLFVGDSFDGGQAGLASIGLMLDQVEQWVAEAVPDQQERIRDFQQALQYRLLARELDRLAPSP